MAPRGLLDFHAYAAQADADLDLLEGALLIASDARPSLDRAGVERELDDLAAPLRELRASALPARGQARALADELAVRAGFHGNTADYYDPRNSFVDQVLERRTGIPISLSVVYLEVARRAGIQAVPVGFPGHFLVGIDEAGLRLAIDPFHDGRWLDAHQLGELLERSGIGISYRPELMDATPVRQVIARMLMNLRATYAQRGDYARLLVVFDRLIDLLPDSATERRDRGFLFARLGAPEAAVDDLERYLELQPNAEDAVEVRRWITQFGQAAERGTRRS
jgi:regulator of sirC expression with transglutaminase-like and TPR domain